MKGPAEFPFDEQRLRAALGLTKDEMRALRKTRLLPADWCIFKKRIFVSAAGVVKLGIELEGVQPEKTAPSVPGAIADDSGAVKSEVMEKTEKIAVRLPEPAAVEALAVVRTDLRNRRLILATRLEVETGWAGSLQNAVRVQLPGKMQPEDFRRGQVIEGRRKEGFTDFYDLVGRPGRRRMNQ